MDDERLKRGAYLTEKYFDEMCIRDRLNSYKCEAGIEYVSNHLNDIKKIDSNYKYEDLRIISLIKACLLYTSVRARPWRAN